MIINMSFLLIWLYLLYTCNALRWTKSGFSSSTETVISLMTAKSTPEIDVSSIGQVTIIRNTKTFERGITIYCFISGYDEKSIIEYSFCKDKDCYNIKDGGNENSVTQFNLVFKFETIFPYKKGLKINMTFAQDKDTSGSYYCSAINNKFAIRSNIIEIRDTMYWGLNLFTKIDSLPKNDIKNITRNSLPFVLNCSDGSSVLSSSAPTWTKIEFVSPVLWSVCPILKDRGPKAENDKMNLRKCLRFSKDRCDGLINKEICPVSLSQISEWTTFVNQGGDLVITDIQPQTNGNIESYSLLCYAKDRDDSYKSINYFYGTGDTNEITKGITFDGVAPVGHKSLFKISPEVQTFVLYARKIPREVDSSSVKPMVISALYSAPSGATVVWRLGAIILSTNNIIKINKYSITFTGEITQDQAGTYTLDVSDKADHITMTLIVTVLGTPIITTKNCMTPLYYVNVGDSVSFTCQFNQRPSDIKLHINSQEIKLSDSLENSKALLKKSMPYLEMLNFSMSPKTFAESNSVEVTYGVYNLTKSLGQVKYQDHTITVLASNDFGMSVSSASIYVVPDLKSLVDYFPDKDNCTSDCKSTMSKIFKCRVRLEEYGGKELVVEQYWTINSNKLGDFGKDRANMYTPYFRVDPRTYDLTMSPIQSNDTNNDKKVKEALKHNDIECHVNLYSLNKEESSFSYQSTTDGKLGSSMRARIILDFVPINTAYIYWIVAIILGLLVLIILVVLVTRYCMKNKGETYPLDKLERKHGYDPDKEVQDEMFKPYERQEHDHEADMGSGESRRLSITGHSVGSNDDGELDNYELDPSNFNEDGSIIGKYGANPRNRAAMT